MDGDHAPDVVPDVVPDVAPDDRPGDRPGDRPRDLLNDVGMATAEYAIATLAACGFAGLLLTLLKSGEVKGLLFGIVKRALSI